MERFDCDRGVVWRDGTLYGPDLWLPLYDLAVEVKGQEDPDDADRWAQYRTERGTLVVLGPDEMKHFHEVSERGDLMELLATFAAAQAM